MYFFVWQQNVNNKIKNVIDPSILLSFFNNRILFYEIIENTLHNNLLILKCNEIEKKDKYKIF